MRSSRKFVVVSAVTLLAAAGCGGSDDAGDTTVAEAAPAETGAGSETTAAAAGDIEGGPIEVGTLFAENTTAWNLERELADSLEADYPGTEVTLTFANAEARPALEQRWRAGDGLDLDWSMFVRSELETWADEGFLADLTPAMDAPLAGTDGSWVDTFVPSVHSFIRHSETDNIYAAPMETTVLALFYNATIFNDLGIEPPGTWAQLLAAADTLKEAGIAPIGVTGMEGGSYLALWTDHLIQRLAGSQAGFDALFGGGTFAGNPEIVEAFEQSQVLRDNGYLIEGFEGTDFTSAQVLFFQGESGMMMNGSWLVAEMADSIPPDFELGVVKFPEVEGGSGDQNGLFGTIQPVSMNAESEHPDLALEYLRRYTSAEIQSRRAEELGVISSVQGVPSPPGLPGIAEVMESGTEFNQFYWGLYSTIDLGTVYWNEVIRLFFGEQDAQETVERLDAAIADFHAAEGG